MKLYHGSPARGIKEFNLDNIRFESVEGNGTYLTPNYRIARGYAGAEGSVYECSFSCAVFDATSKDEFHMLLERLSKKINFNLLEVEYMDTTIEGFVSGSYQITDEQNTGLTWQIKNLLYNNEQFQSLSNSEELIEEIKEFISEYMSQHGVVKYIDKGLGLIFVCRQLDCIKISHEIETGSTEDLELL